MLEPDPILPGTAARPAPPAASAPQGASASAALTADFDTFLRLLTAQMQNQDPLNPTDSTEFTAQLASFSAVEQQIRTNDLLTQMNAGLTRMSAADLGGWLGRDARAPMPVVFEGAPVSLAAPPHPLADRAELVVRNGAGAVVQTVPIPIGGAAIVDWTGMDPTGQAVLPDGIYDITVQSWSGETLIEDRTVSSYATVQEASLVDGEIWLTLQNGLSLRADDVDGLRSPA
ncbi:MAG: flagellar hook assembly protein FlgD [Rhodobacteraceae bacterium]|nr:flagellar hook assembly protein FlgD [Paracoccaceae bacterium]